MILEHVSDINKFLDQIKWILKPGGIILAITHNEKHFLSRILKNKHPIINDEHAYVFSPNSLKKIFQKHNYKIKEISNLKNIYTIKYWLKMIPGFKRFKTYLIWILENTKIFKNLVREGDKVMFVCERDFSNVYKFTLDFKYAKNAKRKLNE